MEPLLAIGIDGDLGPDEPSTVPETRLMVGAFRPRGRIQASVDRARFESAPDPGIRRGVRAHDQTSTTNAGQSSGVVGKVVMASVLGVAGFLGGGYLGAKIEGPCDCDDPAPSSARRLARP